MRRRKEERKQIVLETVAFIIGLTIFLLVIGNYLVDIMLMAPLYTLSLSLKVIV